MVESLKCVNLLIFAGKTAAAVDPIRIGFLILASSHSLPITTSYVINDVTIN